MATKRTQKTGDDSGGMVRVRASLAFGQLARGDELTTERTPRVEQLIKDGKLVVLDDAPSPE
jgi:hypothetical protein